MNDLFRALDPKAFEDCFTAWVRDLSGAIPGLVVIDGKTLRGNRDGPQQALHMVSAWAVAQHVVMGQVRTAHKSNEITAIPQLLERLVLKGAIVTIDAMGCQKAIAAAIVNKDADYVLALKGNQKDLYDDVRTFFESEEGRALPSLETTDADHGRIESRLYKISGDVQWLRERHPDWKGLQSIVMAGNRTTSASGDAPPECQTRFYISSLEPDLDRIANYVRGHWGIENSLHWVLDVTFDEDRCRIRKDNAPPTYLPFLNDAPLILSIRIREKAPSPASEGAPDGTILPCFASFPHNFTYSSDSRVFWAGAMFPLDFHKTFRLITATEIFQGCACSSVG